MERRSFNLRAGVHGRTTRRARARAISRPRPHSPALRVLLRPAVVRLRRHLSDRVYVPRLAGTAISAIISAVSRRDLGCISCPQDANFVPFDCPMDHVVSPSAWAKASIRYRDASMLRTSPRFAARGAIVDVAILPREKYDALTCAPRMTAK